MDLVPYPAIRYVGGGTCTVVAHVALGTNYEAADGSPQSISVGPKASFGVVSNGVLEIAVGGSSTVKFGTDSDGVVNLSGTPGVCTVSNVAVSTRTNGSQYGTATVSYVGIGICVLVFTVDYTPSYERGTWTTWTLVVTGSTTVSVSNIPDSASFGGSFTPSVSTTADGETSVTSSTTSVCTVSSGVVSFVAVGTCTLVAHVAVGTNYSAADGSAQSFAVLGAPRDVSISNIPSSAIFGGTFTPSVSTTGDGLTSVTSLTSSVCLVSDGVVSYTAAGTCTLVSHVASGTNYQAADGSTQSFTVARAERSVSIEAPSYGEAGGGDDKRFMTPGDGTKWMTSSTPDVCTATGNVVLYVGVGWCRVFAHVAIGTNYLAADGPEQSWEVYGKLSYGDFQFPEEPTVGTSFTISAWSESGGEMRPYIVVDNLEYCTLSGFTVTFIAVGECYVWVEISATGIYRSGALAQLAYIIEGTTSVSVENIPSSAISGGSFTPLFLTPGDGVKSVTSSTPDVCTVSGRVVSYIAVGTCTLVSHLALGTNYLGADGSAQSFTVFAGMPSISIANLPSSAVFGEGFTPEISTSGDGETSVTSSTTDVCTVSDGVVSYVAAGTCTLVSHISMSAIYLAADFAQSFTVGRATPSISISNIPSSAIFGGSFTLSLSKTGDGRTFVTSSTPSVCRVAWGVVSYVAAGTCTLVSHVALGTNYLAADGSAQSFTVGRATPSISISNIPSSAIFGGSLTPLFSTPGDGVKSVTSSTPDVCTVSGRVVSYIAVGTCTLVSHLALGTNYLEADGSAQSFTVAKARSSVSISNIPVGAIAGGSFTPTFTTTGDGALSVISLTPTLCSVTDGVVTYVAAGTCKLIAHVDAGANRQAADGVLQSFTVVRAVSTVSLSNIPSNAVFGVSFVPTFITTGDGALSVTSSTPTVCTVKSGVVSYLTVGTCTLVAKVAAGPAFAAGVGVAQSFTIGQGTPSVPSISNIPTTTIVGRGFTPTITTTGDGVKTVASSTPLVCTVTGAAVSYVGVGTCTLTASVADGTKYVAGTGTAQSFTIAKGTPSSPTITNVPTTTVVGGSFLAQVATSSDGVTSVVSSTSAVCRVGTDRQVTFIAAGTCTLTARVAAGVNYNAVVGAKRSFIVT